VTTVAIKKVIAWQLAEEMKKKSITKKRLAELMHTSRAQIDRILDPDKGNVTLETLRAPPRCSGGSCDWSWCEGIVEWAKRSVSSMGFAPLNPS